MSSNEFEVDDHRFESGRLAIDEGFGFLDAHRSDDADVLPHGLWGEELVEGRHRLGFRAAPAFEEVPEDGAGVVGGVRGVNGVVGDVCLCHDVQRGEPARDGERSVVTPIARNLGQD